MILEVGVVMNSKMMTNIYIRSGHWSVIPNVSCGYMFPLLILEGSSEELIKGGGEGFTSCGLLQVCSSSIQRASLRGLGRLL
jgi:hypothetical protein